MSEMTPSQSPLAAKYSNFSIENILRHCRLPSSRPQTDTSAGKSQGTGSGRGLTVTTGSDPIVAGGSIKRSLSGDEYSIPVGNISRNKSQSASQTGLNGTTAGQETATSCDTADSSMTAGNTRPRDTARQNTAATGQCVTAGQEITTAFGCHIATTTPGSWVGSILAGGSLMSTAGSWSSGSRAVAAAQVATSSQLFADSSSSMGDMPLCNQLLSARSFVANLQTNGKPRHATKKIFIYIL